MDKTSIKGTRTEQNLLKSFAGESQARNRYTIFAEVAREEGYEQIASIFMETAEQEFSHAKNFFSYLDEGMLEITASYPAGPVADTARNLKEAAMGEHEEWSDMYVEFARVAREEGFTAIANLFSNVAIVEQSQRHVTSSSLPVWKPEKSSPTRMPPRSGSAATADTSTPANRHRRHAPYAANHRPISNAVRKTINRLINTLNNAVCKIRNFCTPHCFVLSTFLKFNIVFQIILLNLSIKIATIGCYLESKAILNSDT